jgi:hypothetical protein
MTNPHQPSLRTAGPFQSHTVPAAIPRLGLTAPADPRCSAAARRATRAVTAVQDPHGARPSPTSARDLIADYVRASMRTLRPHYRTQISRFRADLRAAGGRWFRRTRPSRRSRVLDQAEERGPGRHQRPACLLLGQPVQAMVEIAGGARRGTPRTGVHSGMRSAISTDAAAGPGTGSRRAAGPRPDAADQGAIRGTFCR